MFLIACLSFVIGCQTQSVDCVPGDQDPGRSENMEETAGMIGAESLSDVVVCRSGSFALMRLRERTSNDVLVIHEGQPMFFASEAPTGNLSAMLFEKGNPKVLLGDADGDRNFDTLSYDVYFPELKRTLTVMDHNLDGQADTLLHPSDDQGEQRIWVGEAWHKMVRQDGQRGVLIDREFLPVQHTDSGWQFVAP